MSDARRRAPLGLAAIVSIAVGTVLAALALVDPPSPASVELANRIPEPAPYVAEEAAYVSPPFEDYWQGVNHPGQCRNCHARPPLKYSGCSKKLTS